MKINILVFPAFALFSILFLVNPPVHAQRNNVDIRGTIIDSVSYNPVDHVSVTIYDKKESKVVATGFSDQQGKFRLTAPLTDTTVFVSISLIGYKKKFLAVAPKDGMLDLGEILLVADNRALSVVEVVAKRPQVEFEGNKMSLQVSNVPNLNHMSTVDVLDYLPFIQADEDALNMMGQPLAILINNKPHPLYSNAKNLKLLPSHAIEKVEVTLVPTARQGSNQKVLNITLKKDYFLGWNGRINLSGSRLGLSPTGQLSYWRKRMGFELSLSSGWSRTYGDAFTTIQNYQTGTVIDQVSDVIQRRKNNVLNTSFYFNLDSSNTIDIQAGIGINAQYLKRTLLINSTETGQVNSIYQNKANGISGNVSLNFTHKFKKPKKEFYFLSRYNNASSNNEYQLFQDFVIAPLFPKESYVSRSDNEELSTELLLQNNSNSKFKYVYGTKMIRRGYSSNNKISSYEEMGPGEARTDSLNFLAQQLVSSSYIDADLQVGKTTVHTGIRVEYTAFTYQSPRENKETFINVLPTLSVSRNISDAHHLSLSYYRNLARPGLSYMLPFITSNNPYEQRTGATGLKPEYTNSYTLQGYGNYKLGSFGLNLTYSRVHNLLDEIASANEEGGILRTNINIDKNDTWTMGFSAEVQFLKKFRLSHMSNLSYIHQNSGIYDTNLWSGYLSESLTMELSKKQRLSMSMVTFSPNLILQGRSQSMAYVNTNLSYSYFFNLLKNLPAGLRVSVNNPWLWKGFPSFAEQRGPDFYFYSKNYRSNPVVSASLQITFLGKKYSGKTFSKNKSIQNNDVKINVE